MATEELETKTHADYTIGWICALSKEQTAATAMLDEKHGDLPNPHHDSNTYTLGSIGNHNVVIACLPDGRYGTSAAANVVTLLAGTYPSVRFCLMVGIGGGIPSKKVQLGDVVVGRPESQFPGVLQWDMGKTKQDGEFERTGVLENPPKAVLTALGKLRTHNELNGSKIQMYLDEFKNKYPAAAEKYVNRDSLVDICFKANYDHITPVKTGREHDDDEEEEEAEEDETDTCRYCDKSKVIKRKNRPMQIHYGLIASGNQVIRDSKSRDKLNQRLGGKVLCIEMEAAGIVNNFPCLVIRGICDYSDSHKNKAWQEHAAAVAAAYAKELLMFVQPSEFQGERLIKDVLNEVQGTLIEIASSHKEQHLSKQQEALFKWLSPLKPSARHAENRKRRVEGTGTWFLQHPKFLDWSSGNAKYQLLPCYGDPGAGKTIIASLVIDHLEAQQCELQIGLGYVYCDYRDQKEQTIENIVGALLTQLLKCLPEIPSAVLEIHEQRISQDRPLSLEDSSRMLQITCAHFHRVYISLDALDELQPTYLETLLNCLCDVPSAIQMFLTGRPHVQKVIQKFAKTDTGIIVEADENDIRRFVEHEIGGHNDLEPDAMDGTLKTQIIDKVVNSAKGIFLLPLLQVQAVLQTITIRDREEALQNLPSNLGDAFAGTMIRIQQQPPALAERAALITAWVHLAERPLGINELSYWLAIRDSDSHFNPRGIPVRETILNCCQGLVVTDRETSTVRLVHYSLQQYLLQQNKLFNSSKEQWHDKIACTCLTFLKFSSSIEGDKETIKELLAYAATQWGYHIKKSRECTGAAFELAKEYLDSEWTNGSKSLDLLYREMYPWNRVTDDLTTLPAHIAAFFGLAKIILHLQVTELALDQRDGLNRTPLLWASENGHEAVVKVLIENSATVDSVDQYRQTPLSLAAQNGHNAVVKVLIENGAAVDSVDQYRQTPLSLAAQNGHEAVVKVLIENGAAVDSVDRHGETPLLLVAGKGHDEVVKILIKNGAAVDSICHLRQAPLSKAAGNGHDAVVKTLIENGAAVDSVDSYDETPVSKAAGRGYETVVKILIENGAAVDSFNNFIRKPLLEAARRGHEAVVKILIENGAEVDSVNEYCRTPLSEAATEGYEAVVRILIKNGAAVNSVDKFGKTPLSRAAIRGHEAIVKILIENGARLDLVDKRIGQLPLSYKGD